MYHKHHTKGIVINVKGEGSDSTRATIFTENFGLVSAKVQGSKYIHSKLRAGTQDFSLTDFSLIHGKAGWKVVSSVSDINFFEVLKSFPEKIFVMGNVLSLVRKLAPEESSSPILFKIVLNFLNFLPSAKDADVRLAECLVLLRILHSLGYMRHDPELSIPISSYDMDSESIEAIAPKRTGMIKLINESLKATQI